MFSGVNTVLWKSQEENSHIWEPLNVRQEKQFPVHFFLNTSCLKCISFSVTKLSCILIPMTILWNDCQCILSVDIVKDRESIWSLFTFLNEYLSNCLKILANEKSSGLKVINLKCLLSALNAVPFNQIGADLILCKAYKNSANRFCHVTSKIVFKPSIKNRAMTQYSHETLYWSNGVVNLCR